MLRFDALGAEGLIVVENPLVVLFGYMRLQLLCLLWNSKPDRVLVLGLGAGILPRILHYLSPTTLIDVVEIDAAVVDVARQYFYFNKNNLTRVYNEDGRDFIARQPSNHYDTILVDVFTVNGRIPHRLRTLECLGEYSRILKDDGVLAANFLRADESRYRQTYERAAFKHLYRGVAEDNFVLIGLNKQARILTRDELQVRAKELQHNSPLPDMDWVEESRSLQNSNDRQWDGSVRIFTDQVDEDIR